MISKVSLALSFLKTVGGAVSIDIARKGIIPCKNISSYMMANIIEVSSDGV